MKMNHAQITDQFLSQAITAVIMIVFLCAGFSYANDTGSEITPSGIQYKQEKNISIEEERLYISSKRIEVAYVFKNHSPEDIVTEVAFPIPAYDYTAVYERERLPDFRDFSVEINGRKIDFQKEVRAIVNGKDYTELLKALDLTIEDFDKLSPYDGQTVKFKKLNMQDQKKLVDLGVFEGYVKPNWEVSIKYHWTQRFPANSTLAVKHSYAPVEGYRYFSFVYSKDDSPSAELTYKDRSFLLKDSCMDQYTQRMVEKEVPYEGSDIPTSWVSYILTTANNWRTPIKKFKLVVEDNAQIVSLCFDHKLTRRGSQHYEAEVNDFIPQKDLKVYFFQKKH